jgi:BlaI family penicillinase repressor
MLRFSYKSSSVTNSCSRATGKQMTQPRLSKLELRIMDALWTRGSASIREIQEAFPEKDRPAYTTIQTTVYRLETKKAVKRVRKVGNFHIFEPAVSRNAAQRRLIDDMLALFGGRTQPVMAHLIESGKLTLEDVKDAEKLLRQLERKEKSK